MHIHIRRRQNRRHIAPMPEQSDRIGQSTLGDFRLDGRSLRAVADKHQLCPRALCMHRGEQIDQAELVFSRLDRTDIDQNDIVIA